MLLSSLTGQAPRVTAVLGCVTCSWNFFNKAHDSFIRISKWLYWSKSLIKNILHLDCMTNFVHYVHSISCKITMLHLKTLTELRNIWAAILTYHHFPLPHFVTIASYTSNLAVHFFYKKDNSWNANFTFLIRSYKFL